MDHHKFLRILIRENLERQILYEGLIFTHSLLMLRPHLRDLGFKDKDFEFNNLNNTVKIKFPLNKNNKERYKKLDQVMNNLGGWYHGASIAGAPLKNKLDFVKELNGQIILQYEPKHDIEVATPETLYHLTKQSKLNKINKIGLTPRSSESFFNFKDRIYFALDKNSLKDFAKQKNQIELNRIDAKIKSGEYKNSNQKKIDLEQAGKFAILTISPNWGRVFTRFFKDPNFFDGYYTKENIGVAAIRGTDFFEV